jgi:hypothetical protein
MPVRFIVVSSFDPADAWAITNGCIGLCGRRDMHVCQILLCMVVCHICDTGCGSAFRTMIANEGLRINEDVPAPCNLSALLVVVT